MNVAIIDDGINEKKFSIGKIEGNWEIAPNNRAILNSISTDIVTHGTVCAGIIKKYAPNAKLYSIKAVTSDNHSVEMLETALMFAGSLDIKIIHLSIGTRALYDYYSLRDIVNQLLRKGIIIVAAQANTSEFTMPASFSGVIGVRTNYFFTESRYEILAPNASFIKVAASSRHDLYDLDGSKFSTPCCNSYAAPLVTAKIVQNICTTSTVPTLSIASITKTTEEKENILSLSDLNLIDQADVVNCSSLPYEKELFVFDATSFSTNLQVQKATVNNDVLVVIPNSECLDAQKNYIKNSFLSFPQKQIFAFAGELTSEMKEWIVKRNIQFWDENCIIMGKELHTGTEVPKYNVRIESSIIALRFFKEIRKKFRELNIVWAAFSDLDRGYLYGFQKLSATQNQVVLYQQNAAPPELVLFYLVKDYSLQTDGTVRVQINDKNTLLVDEVKKEILVSGTSPEEAATQFMEFIVDKEYNNV